MASASSMVKIFSALEPNLPKRPRRKPGLMVIRLEPMSEILLVTWARLPEAMDIMAMTAEHR